jgi:hypothetical protein
MPIKAGEDLSSYSDDCEHLQDNKVGCKIMDPASCAFFHARIHKIDPDHRCRYYKSDPEKKVALIEPLPPSTITPLPKNQNPMDDLPEAKPKPQSPQPQKDTTPLPKQKLFSAFGD